MRKKLNFEGRPFLISEQLTFNSNTKWGWVNILSVQKHMHTLCKVDRLLQRFLEISACRGIMTFSREKFRATKPWQNKVCTFTGGWRLCPSTPYLWFQFIATNPRWRHSGGLQKSVAGSDISCPHRDYLDPASRKQEKWGKKKPYLVLTGPEKQAGDKVFPRRLGLFIAVKGIS